MKNAGYVVLTYAVIVLAGGVMGGFIANSIPSLIAGVTFGALITLNAVKILKGNMRGFTLALIQSIILGSFFVYRLKVSGSFMPAGLMVILSFGVAGYLLMVHPRDVPANEEETKK